MPTELTRTRWAADWGRAFRWYLLLAYSNSMCRQSSIPTSILMLLLISGGFWMFLTCARANRRRISRRVQDHRTSKVQRFRRKQHWILGSEARMRGEVMGEAHPESGIVMDIAIVLPQNCDSDHVSGTPHCMSTTAAKQGPIRTAPEPNVDAVVAFVRHFHVVELKRVRPCCHQVTGRLQLAH